MKPIEMIPYICGFWFFISSCGLVYCWWQTIVLTRKLEANERFGTIVAKLLADFTEVVKNRLTDQEERVYELECKTTPGKRLNDTCARFGEKIDR